MNNCKTCTYALFDPVWGEYKCGKKHRRCTPEEVENGCDKWKGDNSNGKQKTSKVGD